MDNFQVTVIIPVFNKIKYVEQAILSAINQKFVTEVIAIDDGSKDGSYEVLLSLEKNNSNFRVLTHNNRVNRGVSASRNLGIINSRCDFIAFLDADDYFLENRFKNTFELFQIIPEADGIYECVGTTENNIHGDNIMLTENVKSDKLFETLLLEGGKGWFSADGLTVNKYVFDKVGLFNTKLAVAEDTEMWFKISSVFNLFHGELLKPVTIARRNIVKSLTVKSDYRVNYKQMWISLFKWSLTKDIKFERKKLLFERVLEYNCYYRDITIQYQRSIFKLIQIIKTMFFYPKFIFQFLYKK